MLRSSCRCLLGWILFVRGRIFGWCGGWWRWLTLWGRGGQGGRTYYHQHVYMPSSPYSPNNNYVFFTGYWTVPLIFWLITPWLWWSFIFDCSRTSTIALAAGCSRAYRARSPITRKIRASEIGCYVLTPLISNGSKESTSLIIYSPNETSALIIGPDCLPQDDPLSFSIWSLNFVTTWRPRSTWWFPELSQSSWWCFRGRRVEWF